MGTKKIFLGFVDIAGQLGDFAKAYSDKGYDVFTAVYQPNEHYSKRRYSIVLYKIYPTVFSTGKYELLRKLFTILIYIPYYHIFMLWSVFRFDIFHFFWYQEKSNRFFLYLIKKSGKKVVVSFVGSDVRWVPVWLREFDLRNLKHAEDEVALKSTLDQNINLNSRLRNVRVFEKYASIVLSHPEQAQLQLRPYFNFYIPIEIQKIGTKREIITCRIVSIGIRDNNLKGGDLIHNLIEDYRTKEDFN